jgi:predicted permease
VAALVLLLLVTACMNLGLLVLSRTLSRDREFAIRLSVGASRGRILRQVITEQSLLAAAGGAVGCLVAAWTTRLFAATTQMPSGLAPHMTVRSAVAAVALAALSAFLFGFAPVVQSIRPSVTRRFRARTVLIGVQVAAAMILTVVSALLVRGVTRVTGVPLGFDYERALLLDPDLMSHGLKPDAAAAYWFGLEQRVKEMPGVERTAIATLPPFGNRVNIDREGTVFYGVTPSYFQAMGIPIVRGRIFGPREEKVAVVSETLARRKWPGEDPIGKPYREGTVVGVVGDARSVRLGDGSATESYYPVPADELPLAVMIVRTTGEPRSVAGPLMEISRAHNSSVLPSVVLLPDALREKLSSARQVAAIASVLGICALLLAVIGLGGIVAFTVTQRLREIGVRLALGARPRHVCEAVARQFARPVAAGTLAGSALAAGVGFILSRELFGVSPFDPVAHGGALLLFAVVAGAAAAPSVRRALRVDPMTTLRHE